MENHLESAGKSLKSASRNLGSLLYIQIISFVITSIICFGIYKSNTTNINIEGMLIIVVLVSIVTIVIQVFTFFFLVKDLKDAGEGIINYSGTIDSMND